MKFQKIYVVLQIPNSLSKPFPFRKKSQIVSFEAKSESALENATIYLNLKFFEMKSFAKIHVHTRMALRVNILYFSKII